MTNLKTVSFVAWSSRRKLALLILLGLGFELLGLWMIGFWGSVPASSRHSAAESLIIGWVTLVLTSVCIAVYIQRFFNICEELRVDIAGIRYSRWSDKTIPWSEIRKITLYNYKSSRFIILHLCHKRLFPGKGLAALLAGLNRIMTGGDICISLTGTDGDYDEALTAISSFKSIS